MIVMCGRNGGPVDYMGIIMHITESELNVTYLHIGTQYTEKTINALT